MRIITAGFSGRMGTAKYFDNMTKQIANYVPFGHFVERLNIGSPEANQILPITTGDILIQFKHFPGVSAGYLIGSGMFETKFPPQKMLAWLRKCHEVWVPSKWAMEVLKRHQFSESKVKVIPLGVNPGIYHPFLTVKKNLGLFYFLNVSSLAKRKGIDELLRALKIVVEVRPHVRLRLKLDNFLKNDLGVNDARALLREHCVERYVDLISGNFSESEMMVLYRSHDGYVTATRGEGWGLPIIEAAACGLPLVCPFHTGMTEFLEPIEGLYEKVESSSVSFSNNELYKHWGGDVANEDLWHICDVESLAAAMIRMVDESKSGEAQRKAVNASDILRNKFTWEMAGTGAARCLVDGPLSSLSLNVDIHRHLVTL